MKPSNLAEFELGLDRISRALDPTDFPFGSTKDLVPCPDIIGQERASRALAFGIDIPSEGYNIFALGPAGVGKTTVVQQFLSQKAQTEPVPDDWCYVNNFQDPRRPRAMRLPAGRGCFLRDDMDGLIRQAQADIPRAFESDFFRQRQGELNQALQEKQAAELQQLERYVEERGFRLLKTQMGLIIAPVLDGKVLNPEQYEQLPQEIKERFEEHRGELQEALEEATRHAREWEKESQQELEKLTTEVAHFALGHLVDELKEKYADLSNVVEYIEAVQRDIVENVDRFLQHEGPTLPVPYGLAPEVEEGPWLNRYKVNVIVDHCRDDGAPIVMETNPTYYNLVGSVEHRAVMGAWLTDFTMIKGGALHQANGGYLVVDARNLLTKPFAWEALKRALQTEAVRIEEMGQEYRIIATSTLEPEPIPLDVKVVIIGGPEFYYPLQAYDEEFSKLFKIKADFEMQIGRSVGSATQYASFISCRCEEEGLLHFAPDGVAQVVAHGSRLTGDQNKLTTRFSEIADLVREASYWARKAGHDLVTAADVQQALKEQVYRNSRIEERMTEMIQDGIIMIDTEGEVVGQVNGLAVIFVGDYEFGRPSKLTAKTFLGRSGVVNIDREVKLTESIHDKGLLTMSSYLQARYGQEKPISLSASLVFEQGYEGVAGDSASSTELYALLSSISGLPIKQNIAVTGSVNQHGQIQPVGGVTIKVEGFFDVCRAKGLTGDQGVIVPASNVHNLVLRDDVLEAIRAGQFHLYAVKTVDEGISILTGVQAGEIQEDGSYPEGTVNYLVTQRLEEMAAKMEKYGRGDELDEEEGEEYEEGEEEEEDEEDEDDVPVPPDFPLPDEEPDDLPEDA